MHSFLFSLSCSSPSCSWLSPLDSSIFFGYLNITAVGVWKIGHFNGYGLAHGAHRWHALPPAVKGTDDGCEPRVLSCVDPVPHDLPVPIDRQQSVDRDNQKIPDQCLSQLMQKRARDDLQSHRCETDTWHGDVTVQIVRKYCEQSSGRQVHSWNSNLQSSVPEQVLALQRLQCARKS